MSELNLTKETGDEVARLRVIFDADFHGNGPKPWKRHHVEALFSRIAALERENAVLEENAIRFREERDRLRQSQSHEPKEDKSLVELVRLFEEAAIAWQRHHGAWETDRLIYQRNAVLMALRYSKPLETSGLCPHGMPLAENICGPCSEGKPNRPASNTEDRCEHGVWKADHCYQCAKSEKE